MLHDPSDPRRSAAIPRVERRTVTEEVLGRLRELLVRGTLKPGSRIDQAELARAFGVSTVPIREALLRLQSAGLVEVIPHRGVFVSEVSVDELVDIYTTRELLEEQAARLAVPRLTRADLDGLGRLARDMQAAAASQRLEDLLQLNQQFHFTIYRASGRRHLLQLVEQLWDLSARYAHLQLHAVPDRASEALYEIRAIVAACRRGDPDAVAWMVRYKIHQTTAGLLQHMSLPESPASSVQEPAADAPAPTTRRPSRPRAPQPSVGQTSAGRASAGQTSVEARKRPAQVTKSSSAAKRTSRRTGPVATPRSKKTVKTRKPANRQAKRHGA